VVLAADALMGWSGGAGIFRDAAEQDRSEGAAGSAG
jgi:hypothetical protein